MENVTANDTVIVIMSSVIVIMSSVFGTELCKAFVVRGEVLDPGHKLATPGTNIVVEIPWVTWTLEETCIHKLYEIKIVDQKWL